MKHYVYRITNKIHNKHYYGTRTAKNRLPCEDIGIYYFSSSRDKNFIEDQKENPSHYKYKIIRITNTRKQALELEIKLHNKFNVGINESFYNRSKQTSTGFDRSGISPHNKGKKLSKEEIEKLSKALTGIKRTAAAKLKMSIALKGLIKTKEHRKNIGDANRGKVIPQSVKDKISKSHKGKVREPFTKEHKKNMGLSQLGEKNHMTLIIKIYNNKNLLMYVCNSGFMNFCKDNNLPFRALKNSYQNKGKIIYGTQKTKTRAINEGKGKFIGWYAKKDNKCK